ncbi:MAG TPA: DUF3108 domain-containing protein [Pseudomonadales bacterium]|nr:DUF3108 domain-containing protein [Pseudomonadales bacterium]
MFQTTSRIRALIVFLAIMPFVCASAEADPPTPFRAIYKARFKGFPIGATGVRELQKQDDGHYVLTSKAYNFLGKIVEQTAFTMDGDAVLPNEYQYHRTGIGKNRSTVMKFDWKEMLATNELENRTTKLVIPTGTQDKLSYQFKLRHDLTRAYEADEDWPALSYKIDDDGELKEYAFKVVGKEVIDTPIGKFETVKATRSDGNPNRTTNFWLAPAYEFMLVRFEQTEPDGHGFELLLRQAEFDGKKISGK